MKMHPSHRPCLLALAALLARSRTIDLRGNVTHTGNLGSVPSRWLGGSVVRWLGSCAKPQPETRTSRPENDGLVPNVPIPECRIIRKEQANIMQIACAVTGSVPKLLWSTFSQNCSTVAAEALRRGGAKTPWWDLVNGWNIIYSTIWRHFKPE